MMNNCKWIQRKLNISLVNKFAKNLNISTIISKILVGRNIDSEENAIKFLNPKLTDLMDSNIFVNMDKAVKRLINALKNNESIGIFGDYDVDGITSIIVLFEFLEQCGASCNIVIPNRIKNGYGLNKIGIDKLIKFGSKIIVTVDCGVTDLDEVEYAVSKGIEIIIIDHHALPEKLPNAIAIINPHQKKCRSNAKYLCTVGIIFNLCIALKKSLKYIKFFKDKKEPILSNLLDLVALGTVADVVPLVLDNRIFVKYGLKKMSNNSRLGIKALLSVASISSKKISAASLAFYLAPRINAAGRLEDAMISIKLLRSKNINESIKIAEILNKQNLERQNIEKKIMNQAIVEIENSTIYKNTNIIVIGDQNWHSGVIGIVASRLVEKFGKPTIIIGKDGKGSGRSTPNFHLYNALCQIKNKMLNFGGHAYAVGVHINFNKLKCFRDALSEYSEKKLKLKYLSQIILHDGELKISSINKKFINDLSIIEPCGSGNLEASFRLNNIKLKNIKELKGGHFSGYISCSNVSFIAFNLKNKIFLTNKLVDIIMVPKINEWMGREKIQLRILDIKESKL